MGKNAFASFFFSLSLFRPLSVRMVSQKWHQASRRSMNPSLTITYENINTAQASGKDWGEDLLSEHRLREAERLDRAEDTVPDNQHLKRKTRFRHFYQITWRIVARLKELWKSGRKLKCRKMKSQILIVWRNKWNVALILRPVVIIEIRFVFLYR